MTATAKIREALNIAWQDRRAEGEIGEVFIKALTALDALEKERDADKKKIWIGDHVQKGWIAFDGNLFDPEFYEIKEKPPTIAGIKDELL